MRLISSVFSVLIVSMLAGVSFAATGWPNEPAGSYLMTDNPLNTKDGNGWTAQYPLGGKIVSDPAAPMSPPNVLQYSRSNMTTGDACQSFFGFQDKNEIYVGFWWKPSNPFTGWQTGQNKVLLIKNHPSNHLYLLMNGPQGGPFSLGIQFAYSTQNVQLGGNGDNPGPRNVFPNAGNGSVTLGAWHRVEMYMKNGASTTSQDGIMRVWLNGNLILNYTQVNYPGPFWSVWMAPIWDAGIPLPFPEYHWFDHIRISEPNGAPEPFLITTGVLPPAQSGKPYAAYLKANGGKSPYSWTIFSGNLLPGLTLNKGTGVISGTPTTGGRCDFTVKLLDASMPPAEVTKSFSIIASGTSGIVESGKLEVESEKLGAMSAQAIAGGVRVQMPQDGAHSLAMFDVAGQMVWSHAGTGEAVWNHGGKLRKGVYLIRAEQNGKVVNTNYCQLW